jgi:hypothetical protein
VLEQVCELELKQILSTQKPVGGVSPVIVYQCQRHFQKGIIINNKFSIFPEFFGRLLSNFPPDEKLHLTV